MEVAMIKVLIVEDERLIIQLIKNSIDWPNLDMEAAGEARNGEQALELIPELEPHIVLMDINMPIMGGIETSKVIRQLYPDIKIIILTGYGEFKYAREAINLGVIRYIMKPIDSKELTQALLDVKQDILEKNAQLSFVKNAQHHIQLIEKENFLNSLISEDKSSAHCQPEKEMVHFQVRLAQDGLAVFIAHIDQLKAKFPEEHRRILRKFVLLNVTEEIWGDEYSTVVFNGPEEQIIGLFNYKDRKNDFSQSLQRMTHRIDDFIRKHFDFTVTFAVSDLGDGFDSLPGLYKEASTALRMKFLSGYHTLLLSNGTTLTEENNDYRIFYVRNEISLDIRLDNELGAVQKVKRIFETLHKIRASREFTIFIVLDLISLIQENKPSQNKRDLIHHIKEMETIQEIEHAIVAHYTESITQAKTNRKSATVRLVEKAKAYIEHHYTDGNLSLDEIAIHTHISSVYMCKIFKKELNCSVMEYVSQRRLAKAKEMLDRKETGLLTQVSERVGYKDQYYFSKCFKKQYGLTPSQYIENQNM
jgi:two-component system response regulator YesN